MKLSVKHFNRQIYEASVLDEDLLNGGEIYLGREDDCHIKLDSQMVSRHHAIIAKIKDHIILKVLSHYGGVRVNGNEVTEIPLNNQDKITIEDYEIVLNDIPIIERVVIEEEKNDDDLTALVETPLEEVASDETEEVIDDAAEEVINDEFKDDIVDVQKDVVDEFSDDDDSFEVDTDENSEESEDSDDGLNQLHLDELESDNDNLDFNNGQSEESNDDFEESNDFENQSDYQDEYENNENYESEDNFQNDDFNNDDGFGDDGFGDDGFGDDGFGDDGGFGGSSDSDSTQVMQNFAQFTLSIFGEYAPFERFLIDQNEIFIGKDPEKCQIVLNDPEVSRVHAKIERTPGGYALVDADSSNGILFNGERINKAPLTNGDEFLIGDTTFTVIVSSDILEEERGRLMPVEDGQEVEIEEVVDEEVEYDELGEGAEEVQEKSIIKRILKDPKRAIIYGSVLLILAVALMPEDDPNALPDDDGSPSEVAKVEKKKDEPKKQMTLSESTKISLEESYSLALAKFKQGEYEEAKIEIDKVMSVYPDYKDSKSLAALIQEGLNELTRLREKEKEEKERKERQLKIAQILEKAKEAVKNRQVELSKTLFNSILELDPENSEVPPLKLEIEAYVAQEEAKRLEEERAKTIRMNKVEKLKPGKALYLNQQWFQAVNELQKFVELKDMDEDLLKEGTEMLKESKRKLLEVVTPLLSKARSYKEGEDLKQAYETYGQVLEYDPGNEEAIQERGNIFDLLTNRSRRVYREALVAESLSLFSKAKEKFQEVQQISPINSEYYIKASDKLKNYME